MGDHPKVSTSRLEGEVGKIFKSSMANHFHSVAKKADGDKP